MNRTQKAIFLSIFLAQTLVGQCPEYDTQPPHLKDVLVRCFVTQDRSTAIISYYYSITNGPVSSGCVKDFEIDLSYPRDGVRLSNIGLFDYPKYVDRTAFQIDPSLQVIPVGIPKLPRFKGFTSAWFAGFGVKGTLDWIRASDRFKLEPGATIDSLTMTSYGIPCLRSFLVSPSYNPRPAVVVTPANEDSVRQNVNEPSEEEEAAFSRQEDSIKVRGLTIGPTAPPLDFIPTVWLDTLISYTTESRSLGWITTQAIADKYVGYFASAKAQLQANNIAGARSTLQTVLQDVNVDSSSTLTSEAYALIRFNTEYLLAQLPAPPPPGLVVKLVNSVGTNLTSGSLQYYDGTWKDATNNNDGTFSITTSLKTLSLRMSYEGGSQTKSNVAVGSDIVVFQTVNAQAKLQNGQGAAIDTGTVQYYAGSWRSFGTTTSGIATKELLPGSYSFRMTYVGGSNDKQQDIGSNPVVVFQTVNTSVQLKSSQGTLMDQGTVQYYAGAWRSFGATVSGIVSKELLPNSYSFRMTYAFASKDQQQHIGTNPTVVFQTVNATVQLKNSQGALMDQGTVQYYSGAWRSIGTTSSGSVSKELLPINYSFRMTNEGVSNDKAQDISANSIVSFSTVLCTVSVKNSQSQPVNNAQISYYSGAWRQIGPTVSGQVTKELLPANLTFRMTLGTTSQDKAQNIAANALVEFITQ